jgi:MscS family membrane protein
MGALFSSESFKILTTVRASTAPRRSRATLPSRTAATKEGLIMTRRIRHRYLVTIVAILIAVGTFWTVPLEVQADSTQPSLKELIEKMPQEGQATEQASSESAALGIPDDPLGRGTPRSSVRGYLLSARARNYVQAAEYLDLRNLPPEMSESQGPELARQLKIVLDRALWIDLETLSTSPEGDRDDNLPIIRDRIAHITAEGKTYDLLLQRVPNGDGVYIWKFSGVTVADIPQLYHYFGYGSLERIFPAWLFDVSVLGIHLWLWVVIIVICTFLYPVAMVLTKAVVAILHRVRPELAEPFQASFRGPITLLLWTILVRSAEPFLGSSITLRAISQTRTVQVIGLAWLLLRVIDFAAQRVTVKLDQKGLGGSRVLLTPVARLVKFVALAGAVLLWLDNAGYKVTTLLAGLSISGVAVALASQKSLENIFGAVTLFTARPVKVGDFCRFGDKMGTVEEIGLRATKVRTLERSVISIANSEFSNMHLDNLSLRDRFWYHPMLQLRYETTPDQIRYILVEVRKMLYAHPKVLSDPLHVRFTGFGSYSLDLDVFAYIGVTDYTESLGIAEDLNLRIMDIVSAAGSDFAFPSQIEYSLPGKPFDEQRAQAVGLEVKEWKAKRALYLPSFPSDKIAELKGSLDYPPEGSPQCSPGRLDARENYSR